MIPRPIKVATYNVHRCHGTDGRYDPHRVAEVLKSIDADLVGLQEVDSTLRVPVLERRGRSPHGSATADADPPRAPEKGPTLLEYLGKATGLQVVEGYLLHSRWGLYGNALLTRYPVTDTQRIDLTVRGGRERRGALDVGIRAHGIEIRVVVAHLGVQLWERHFQVGRLLRSLSRDKTPYLIIMGDFNLWLTMLPKLRRFYRWLGHAPLARTFPSRAPLLSLDRIWAQPSHALRSVEAYRTPLSRVASDHLPLVGRLDFSDLKKEPGDLPFIPKSASI